MKAGIYFSGLGHSFNQESLEKYAARFMNEMRFANGKIYSSRVEKIRYAEHAESTVITIYEGPEDGQGKVVYKLYDFDYYKLLTARFYALNILRKNLNLLSLVLKKLPLAIWRLIDSNNYSHGFQSFYIFMIFFLIASAIFISIPSAVTLVMDYQDAPIIHEMTMGIRSLFNYAEHSKDGLTEGQLRKFIELAVSLTAVLVFIVPHAKNLVLNLASEFLCANNYMEYGDRRQVVQGNLELLMAYIQEHDPDCKVHFHAYSFGSLIAIDYLFPIGHPLSANTKKQAEALISIASPAEFVKAYYPGYFSYRTTDLDSKLKWLNVYSVSDALATNYRRDRKAGESQFGLFSTDFKPINLNYEIQTPRRWSLIDFMTLYPIRVHNMYWDSDPAGQNSLRLVYQEMCRQNLFD